MKFHYRTITDVRSVPPLWRIVDKENQYGSPTDRHLHEVDALLQAARESVSYGGPDDIVGEVFANQMAGSEVTSRSLAGLIEERRDLTKHHLDDTKRRVEALRERVPLRPRGPGFYDDATLTPVEREIFDLEKQERALEMALWRDTQELRTTLVEQRRDRHALERRIGYLAGPTDYGWGGGDGPA